ncbi:hypothetical protein [Ktedonobacter racemifer]|uniref:hypothetical protein n=1 Tax=Ktedonobacter racemifer TaxID=363277 RepID=UPI0012FB0AFF|nr:hypothetical protein [Ktedonobacter racemifer]
MPTDRTERVPKGPFRPRRRLTASERRSPATSEPDVISSVVTPPVPAYALPRR